MDEIERIRNRYDKRGEGAVDNRYSYLKADVYMSQQEKERALIKQLQRLGWSNLRSKRVLEVGCGTGGNLANCVRYGFDPANLVGSELLVERYEEARRRLPPAIDLILGDAASLHLPSESFDVVMQSTVFTSILDEAFQQRLADTMWRLVKPGGGVLWYDFVVDNPKNRDVHGVKKRRIEELFPDATISSQRVTLAPPISRLVCKIHPQFYTIFNCIPLLRTHILCWLAKS